MPTPTPFSDNHSVNPGIGGGGLTSSGGGASGVHDWYVHLQTVDLMYVRTVQNNMSTSTPIAGPAAQSNYLDFHYKVTTSDEIWQDTAFSGEFFVPHQLELVTTVGSLGGFGVCGVVNTSTAGYIRRVARTDAAGNILDPTGVCTKTGNLVLDQMPGDYNITFDTSAQTNAILLEACASVHVACPTFIVSLVDL